MQKLIILTAGLVIFGYGVSKTVAVSEQTMIDTVTQTAQKFQEEQGSKSCTIGGQKFSLGAMLYALAIQEGGRKDGTAGDTTNNWGSLHKNQGLKTPVGYIRNDGTKKRPVYASAEDGVYEKAELITRGYNNCKFTRKSVKCYIYGCEADENVYVKNLKMTRKQHINKAYNALIYNAKQYDNIHNPNTTINNPITPKPTVKSDIKIEDDSKVCRKIKTIQKSDRVQADHGDQSQFMDISSMQGDRIRLYSCYKK